MVEKIREVAAGALPPEDLSILGEFFRLSAAPRCWLAGICVVVLLSEVACEPKSPDFIQAATHSSSPDAKKPEHNLGSDMPQ